MKILKFTLATLFCVLFSISSYSQTLFVPSGTSGIGASSVSGAVGIGMSNPTETFQVHGSFKMSNADFSKNIKFSDWDCAGNGSISILTSNQANTVNIPLNIISNFTYFPGKVGIGVADSKGYMFAVGGSMIAESIVVKLKANWPDFVFAENHKLKSLTEIEAYIKENKHLPDVPSEREVKENGIDVAKMNAILLQKIEELTLIVIEQDKKIKQINKENGKANN